MNNFVKSRCLNKTFLRIDTRLIEEVHKGFFFRMVPPCLEVHSPNKPNQDSSSYPPLSTSSIFLSTDIPPSFIPFICPFTCLPLSFALYTLIPVPYTLTSLQLFHLLRKAAQDFLSQKSAFSQPSHSDYFFMPFFSV